MIRIGWTGFLSIVLIVALATLLQPQSADARAGSGGSLGSRGSRTFSAPPPTRTAPSPAAPIERSMTPEQRPTAPQAGIAPQPAPLSQGGFFSRGGGFLPSLMGGLIGAGIGGMLFGHGFFGGLGGMGSIFGLILQLVIVVFVVRLIFGFFRNRSGQTGAYANPPGPYGEILTPAYPAQTYAPASLNASASATIAIEQRDFETFETLLGSIQSEWNRADLAALRRHVTPEMLSYFSEQLATNTSRGIENHVDQVKMLEGDLSEAWEEGGIAYATVAMRYSLHDWMVESATGKVVDGDPAKPSEVTELWTFMRAQGGQWLLSAIQQT